MNDKNHLEISQQDKFEIDALKLIHSTLQGKWLILFFALLAFMVAFIYAYGQSPRYKADTLLRVEPQKSIPGIEGGDITINQNTSVGTELELIKSRKNIGFTIETLKLDILAQPKKVPLFSNLYKRFFSPTETKKLPLVWEKFDKWAHKFAWGNEQIKVDRLDVPDDWLNVPLKLIAKQDSDFEIRSDDDILFEGKVGESSTSKDNSFSIYVSELTGLPGTEFNISKLSNNTAIAYLQSQIIASERGVQTGLISLSIRGENKEDILETLDTVSKTYVEQNKSRSSEEANNALNFLEEQIRPVQEEVDKARANIRNYRVENKSADLSKETQEILNVISEIDAELQKYSLSRENLSQKYTDQHPTILALNAQVNKLKIRKEITQQKITKLPNQQQKLLKLESESKVANAIYIDLLNKIQEFKIAKASTVGNAYIVDHAYIDEYFVSTNEKKVLTIGTFLGAVLGLFIVFIRMALQHTVDDPDKLENVTGIPVYATIPLSKNVKLTSALKAKDKKQKSLLATDNKNDPAIEGLRSLRTSLHFALHEAKNNIVMLTGPSPNIGKSFISSNFAAVAASAGQRVMLIDADMRKGYLHDLLGLKLAPGLSDIITKKATIEDIIHTVKVGEASMDVITRGQTPPNPSELLMHDYFKKLLDYLSNHYDLILIDSPPIHAVTDPTIIGSHAGVVFMVVRSEEHSIKEIEHAIKLLSHTGINTKGFIFNGYVAKNSRYGYGFNYYGEYK
jgi:tyrosine-protein kinase Etk/Wzc